MGHSTKQDYIDNFTIIIKDSDSFLKNNRIYRGDTFSYFNYLFSVILKYSSSSVSDYVSAYRNVSPYVNVSFKNIIKANDFNLKCYLRKLHYLMPTCIAPYWQYYVFVILRGFYRKIMRK